MKIKIVSYVSILIFLVSCYPKGPDYYEDLDVVYTDYDQGYDFASKGTYSIPDKIVKMTGEFVDGGLPEFVDEPGATQMLNEMKKNMQELGWEEVAEPANADVILFPAAWTNTTVYYWYDYWCWYYPYYCGGWGWGYPSVTTVTAGTLVMTIVPTGDGGDTKPMPVWTGMVNGLLSGAYDTSRATDGIDQAFDQSPYLKTN